MLIIYIEAGKNVLATSFNNFSNMKSRRKYLYIFHMSTFSKSISSSLIGEITIVSGNFTTKLPIFPKTTYSSNVIHTMVGPFI